MWTEQKQQQQIETKNTHLLLVTHSLFIVFEFKIIGKKYDQ